MTNKLKEVKKGKFFINLIFIFLTICMHNCAHIKKFNLIHSLETFALFFFQFFLLTILSIYLVIFINTFF